MARFILRMVVRIVIAGIASALGLLTGCDSAGHFALHLGTPTIQLDISGDAPGSKPTTTTAPALTQPAPAVTLPASAA